ncbi:MAG: transcriptional repressor [Succinivibrio sp.]|jgi:Fur family peroxide stress response transcriptional regulator|nr:transcriptional repressor [Succinivibrio sp.]
MEIVRRNSRQRTLIRALMRGRTDHPDASQIYGEVREHLPSVSLATVYRNLTQLVESGELAALEPGDGKTHFDPTVAPHAHFLCTRCGRVSDVKDADTQELKAQAERSGAGRVDSVSVSFTGICEDCLKKTQKISGQ